MEKPKLCGSECAAIEMMHVARSIHERTGNGSGLHLSHSGSASVGRKLVQLLTGKKAIANFEGKAAALTAQLEKSEIPPVDASVVNFALHNCTPEQAMHILTRLSDATKKGIVLVTDYTLRGIDPANVQSFVTSEIEQRRISEYGGFDQWLKAHDCFSIRELKQMTSDAGFCSVSATQLSAGRGMVIASNKCELHAEELLAGAPINLRIFDHQRESGSR
jgi:hypothetical protein